MLLLLLAACGRAGIPPKTSPTAPSGHLSYDEILQVAAADAQQAYADLSIYQVTAVQHADTWQVDYELKDPELSGGGPHYTIDAQSGAILSKRYEQ